MMEYRSRFEIVRDILNICRKPSAKTRVMNIANMSYTQREHYLRELTKRGLIECCDNRYLITNYGKEFLEGLEIIIGMWDYQFVRAKISPFFS